MTNEIRHLPAMSDINHNQLIICLQYSPLGDEYPRVVTMNSSLNKDLMPRLAVSLQG